LPLFRSDRHYWAADLFRKKNEANQRLRLTRTAIRIPQGPRPPRRLRQLNNIRTGDRLHSDIEEAHKSTLLCHLGNIAQRMRRPLRYSSRDGSIQNDKEAMGLWTREYQKGFEPRV
jgi:hypothetical protein